MTETPTKQDVRMNEHVELIGLIDNPPARRLWLLCSALKCLPFDRAIELARAAEAFVRGSHLDSQAGDTRGDAEAPAGLEQTERFIKEASSGVGPVEEPIAKKRTRLALSAELRDRLLDRLAEDAKNAELAAEFGLSLQQVQGVRIGCAREIAKRRAQLSRKPVHSDQTVIPSASIDEIVRYLRQQDDVVVPQENGHFLINGRFHLAFADLVSRANRMRARQRKPEFEMIGDKPSRPKPSSAANGHPLFWKEPAPAQPPFRKRDRERSISSPEGA
jgi:hypothetical protein